MIGQPGELGERTLMSIKTEVEVSLQDFKDCLALNFSNFNKKRKSEVIIFGHANFPDGINSVLGPLPPYNGSSFRIFGGFLDSLFKLDKQICSVKLIPITAFNQVTFLLSLSEFSILLLHLA